MYSYEDRVRAVELFIKLGKRVRPTIRQLGYPTKNSLKGWFREYEQRLDLPMGYAGREPKFSQAQKEAAVEHYLTHDRCIAATMRALGYPCRGTLTVVLGRASRSLVEVEGERVSARAPTAVVGTSSAAGGNRCRPAAGQRTAAGRRSQFAARESCL